MLKDESKVQITNDILTKIITSFTNKIKTSTFNLYTDILVLNLFKNEFQLIKYVNGTYYYLKCQYNDPLTEIHQKIYDFL